MIKNLVLWVMRKIFDAWNLFITNQINENILPWTNATILINVNI